MHEFQIIPVYIPDFQLRANMKIDVILYMQFTYNLYNYIFNDIFYF